MFIPNTIRIKCLFQDHRQVQIGVRFVTLFVIITYTIHTENKRTVPRIDSLSVNIDQKSLLSASVPVLEDLLAKGESFQGYSLAS